MKIWHNALQQEPYADVREVRFVLRPENWTELVDQPVNLAYYLDGQKGLTVSGKNLRNMRASDAFLPGSRFTRINMDRADLRHSVLTASQFEDVSLLGADLTDAALTRAVITATRLEQVAAVASHFDRVIFTGSEKSPTSLSGNFSNANFNHASGSGFEIVPIESVASTLLINTSLQRVDFRFAKFTMVDFSDAQISESRIVHSLFKDVEFSGTKIRELFFNFSKFKKCRFINTFT
ncbi:MAG: pentapeptide repeat-containing protein [Leptothrix sp. (in: b-proteobacteria)]